MSSRCWRLCPQAFTVVTVFNAMTFSLKVTPFSVKSLSEASVAIDRFKVRDVPVRGSAGPCLMMMMNGPPVSLVQGLFLLPEVDGVPTLPGDPQVAVEMRGASLAWEGGRPSAHPSPVVRSASGQQRHRDK